MTDVTDTNNVYLNVVFPGAPPTGQEHGVAATQDVTRTQPIINNPDEWFLSIIRLTLPMNSEPIYIMPVIPVAAGNSPFNKLLTPFVIGITYNGNWYGANVLWQPELIADFAGIVPDHPNPTDFDSNNSYFWMYSYDTLLSMVNAAVKVAFTAYVAANPAGPGAAFNQPWLSLDSATGLLSWTYHSSWSTPPDQSIQVPVPATPRLAQNIALQSILDGFRTLLVGIVNPTPFINNPTDPLNAQEIYVATQCLANTNPLDTAYFSTTQTVAILASWASLRRIIVTSNSLPAIPEIIPAPPTDLPTLQYNAPIGSGPMTPTVRPLVSGIGTSGGASSYPIICDMIPAIGATSDLRGIAYYVPDAQYRLVDLLTSTPLYKFDLTISWVDTQGAIHPIVLARNQQASLKIAFVKKTLYIKPPAPISDQRERDARVAREEQLQRYRQAATVGGGRYRT